MNVSKHLEETPQCVWEERVARAAGGPITDEHTRAHIAACEDCRALADIVHALAEYGRTEELRARGHVPDPDALIALAGEDVFARPASAQRWTPSLVARVLRPVVWIERIAIGLAAIALIAIMAWITPRGDATATGAAGLVEPSAASAQTDPADAVIALTALLIIGIAGYGVVGLGSVRPAGGILARTR